MAFILSKQTTYTEHCMYCYDRSNDFECSVCNGDNEKQIEVDFPKFITVYEETQAYGGPEEGGWWYDAGVILEMIQVDTQEQEDMIVNMFTKRYNDPDDRELRYGKTSAAGGYDIILSITKKRGEPYPKERPYYE